MSPGLRCVSDRYDRDGSIYADVEEFLDMCQACFGETPTLREFDGDWYEVDEVDEAAGQRPQPPVLVLEEVTP